jgi:hypothetical protein
MIVMAPEVDLVAGLDAQFVAKLLWDHDLALRADTMSHTIKYNRAGLMTPSDADSVVAPVGFCAFTKNARSTSRMPLRPPVQLAECRPADRGIAVILCVSTTVAPGSARSAQNAGSVGDPPIRRPLDRGHSVLADDPRARVGEIGAERRVWSAVAGDEVP